MILSGLARTGSGRAWVARWLVALLVVPVSGGCHSGGPGSSEPEVDRRSETEYDLARDAWMRRGNPREALKHALLAVEIDDQNADAHHIAALLYLDLCQRSAQDCRLDESERHARRALDVRSDYREAKNTLGVVLIHAKRPAEAISVLEPLTRDILYPTPENAWGNLGWAYLQVGRLDDAIQALHRSVAAQPRFCVGFYRLGLAHEKKHQPEAALESYSQALDADPRCRDLQDAVAGRARAAMQLGRVDDARADLKRCVDLAGSTPTGKECGAILAKLK